MPSQLGNSPRIPMPLASRSLLTGLMVTGLV
jgi:hypothetical protein